MSNTRAPGSDTAEQPIPDELLGIGAGEDILIVDDNEANLVAFDAALAPLGRKLVMVQSGVEALAKMLAQDFALVILDVSMPGMSGLECAQMIRERKRTRGVPILFVTGLSVQDQAILEGYEVGGFDFLVKPIRAEVLRAKVRVFLTLQERTREMQRHARARQALEAAAYEMQMREQEQRHQSELLEMRVEQLNEMDRRKDELLAILGHQLRNPLQALQLAIDTLHGQTDVPPHVLERIHHVFENRVQSLNQLVNDLLDIAKLSAGEIELEPHPVKLADLVRQVVETAEPSLEGRTIELALDDRTVVGGDATRLARCITNLLDNAIKFTERGTGKIRIELSTANGKGLLRVSDNGRGIPRTLLPQIFDIFSRSEGTAGLGLGLAIVKRLVEVHGGSVRATSEGEGHGAVFEIQLTAVTTVAPHVEEDLRPTRPLRVVVCEDANDIRELAADLLRADGHTVFQAADGTAAIALIEAERPDVALVDLVLPDIDGFTVARTVRLRLGKGAPRLVAITALTSAASSRTDFDEHLLKPASRERILSVLARVSD
ncbi:MAG TPA: response regulator [Kofleriaceae bacterium]